MEIIYSDQPSPQTTPAASLFLAGPTPRSPDVKSWRPEALDILRNRGYNGRVWVPEWSNFSRQVDYLTQVNWEKTGLLNSVILFWVPRNLETMPAMTTNVEAGRYWTLKPKECVYGRPDHSPKNDYLDWLWGDLTGRKLHSNLENTIIEALKIINERCWLSGQPLASKGESNDR